MTDQQNLQMELDQTPSELKWPRHWARDICMLEKIEDRREALSKVPLHFQDMVKKHVADYFWKRQQMRNRK